VAREWARDSFTASPAAMAVSRPRIDLG
jgi:hypothetical protein